MHSLNTLPSANMPSNTAPSLQSILQHYTSTLSSLQTLVQQYTSLSAHLLGTVATQLPQTAQQLDQTGSNGGAEWQALSRSLRSDLIAALKHIRTIHRYIPNSTQAEAIATASSSGPALTLFQGPSLQDITNTNTSTANGNNDHTNFLQATTPADHSLLALQQSLKAYQSNAAASNAAAAGILPADFPFAQPAAANVQSFTTNTQSSAPSQRITNTTNTATTSTAHLSATFPSTPQSTIQLPPTAISSTFPPNATVSSNNFLPASLYPRTVNTALRAPPTLDNMKGQAQLNFPAARAKAGAETGAQAIVQPAAVPPAAAAAQREIIDLMDDEPQVKIEQQPSQPFSGMHMDITRQPTQREQPQPQPPAFNTTTNNNTNTTTTQPFQAISANAVTTQSQQPSTASAALAALMSSNQYKHKDLTASEDNNSRHMFDTQQRQQKRPATTGNLLDKSYSTPTTSFFPSAASSNTAAASHSSHSLNPNPFSRAPYKSPSPQPPSHYADEDYQQSGDPDNEFDIFNYLQQGGKKPQQQQQQPSAAQHSSFNKPFDADAHRAKRAKFNDEYDAVLDRHNQYSERAERERQRDARQAEKENVDSRNASVVFMSGADKLLLDDAKKNGGRTSRDRVTNQPKSLGVNARRRFVPPYKKQENEGSDFGGAAVPSFVKKAVKDSGSGSGKDTAQAQAELPEKLKMCDPKLVEMIQSEIMESPGIKWDDIAGLEFAKKSVMEIVVWPLKRPDLFTGLRGPPKGILLFGPPGTGKTLIGKAIASESGAKFFSISASSLTSKWHGEGEKLVRTLFAVASCHSPAIIFIDEIDSLLSQRSDGEFEASRRIKTEFLIQLDGVNTSSDERILVVGATNRPQELDEAARRRLVKRLYIPLPDVSARRALLSHLLSAENHALQQQDVEVIVTRSEGYSGADVRALCTEAAFGPIRSVGDISNIQSGQVRPIVLSDFEAAFKQQYGSFPYDEPLLHGSNANAAM